MRKTSGVMSNDPCDAFVCTVNANYPFTGEVLDEFDFPRISSTHEKPPAPSAVNQVLTTGRV
ncbi:MAG: hypothetical protein V1784_06490 [bacterium]